MKTFTNPIQLGNISDWVYEMYGERGAEKSADLETEFSNGDIKDVLRKHFPRVHGRFLEYERTLSEVSSKRFIDLQLVEQRKGFVELSMH